MKPPCLLRSLQSVFLLTILMLPRLPNRGWTLEMKRQPSRLSVFNTRLPHTVVLAVNSDEGGDYDRKASVIEMTLPCDCVHDFKEHRI